MGQLGLGVCQHTSEPIEIEFFKYYEIINVFLGNSTTFVQTSIIYSLIFQKIMGFMLLETTYKDN